jgi:hypothetical protein
MWNIISITVTHLKQNKCYTFICYGFFQLLYMAQRKIKMSYSNDRLMHYLSLILWGFFYSVNLFNNYSKYIVGGIMSYLFYLCLFVKWCPTHYCVVFLLCFSSSMLPVSLDCIFLIVPSVFSNVYWQKHLKFNSVHNLGSIRDIHVHVFWKIENVLFDTPDICVQLNTHIQVWRYQRGNHKP